MLPWRPRTKTTRIIVASSHTPLDTPSVTRLLAVRGRMQGLLEGGYHFVIERNGECIPCRPNDVFGSHTRMANHDSVAICLGGGWEGKADHTPEQLTALSLLVQTLRAAYGPLPLVGQNEVWRRPGSPRSPAIDMDQLRAALPLPLPEIPDAPDMAKTPKAKDTAAIPGRLSAQQRLVVDYLKAGHTLTPLIALTNLGIGSITSRVAELKAGGYPIIATPDNDFHGGRYMKYTWAKDKHGRNDPGPQVA
jgi:hypothetical protein